MKHSLIAIASVVTLHPVWSQKTTTPSKIEQKPIEKTANSSKINFVEYDLPNGLHVILHEDRSVPIVAVSIAYHVGSKNEKSNRTGFAHFFEHLLFEGSKNIGRGEYAKIVEKNGGTLNANTSQDRTYYYEILPSNQLELGLWMESERLLHARVDKTGIETQRQVVKEEKRQSNDNQPYGSFLATMCKKVFQNHPYSWIPIGDMEHLDAAQEEDYVNFYKDFYVPSNAVLSIAGDLSIESTKKLINNYFSSIPKGQAINLYRDFVNYSNVDFKSKYGQEKSIFDTANFLQSKNPKAIELIKKFESTPISFNRTAIVPTPLKGQTIDTVYDNIQLPGVFVGYRFPEQNNKDFAAVQIMNSILSDGNSSRMNKSLVEKKQQAVASFSFGFPLEEPGLGIVASIGANGIDSKTILQSMDEEIERIQNELVSKEELEKVINQYENTFIETTSTVAGVAENLADNYMYRKNTNLINKQLEAYLSVTAEDVQRVAKKYFTKDARVILVYLPKQAN